MPTREPGWYLLCYVSTDGVYWSMMCFHRCMTILNLARFWNLPCGYWTRSAAGVVRHSCLAKEDTDGNASFGLPIGIRRNRLVLSTSTHALMSDPTLSARCDGSQPLLGIPDHIIWAGFANQRNPPAGGIWCPDPYDRRPELMPDEWHCLTPWDFFISASIIIA